MKFILLALLSGCAFPQYEYYMVPSNGKPLKSTVEAGNICNNEAEQARQNARTRMQEQINRQNSQVVGYNCNTQSTPYYSSYQSSTNCVARTYGQNRSVFSPVEDLSKASAAGQQAYEYQWNVCMARFGWMTEQVCVKNCN